MKVKSAIHSVNWGIAPIDLATSGVPDGEMSIVETPDHHSGSLVLGHFLHEGLKNGDLCAYVTFDSAKTFLENFLLWNIDFEKYILSEQLIILNYRSNFSFEIGLSHQYETIFQEVSRLCKGSPRRIAIQQIDTMINLNNISLMNSTSQKLSSSIRNDNMKNTAILGQFVQFGDRIHNDLRISFQKVMSAYFSLRLPDKAKPFDYLFQTDKLPWFNYLHQVLALRLSEGQGFVTPEDAKNDKAA